MCACGSADGRRRRAACGRRSAVRDERVDAAPSSSSNSNGFGAKDTSEVAARWQNLRGDGGLAFEVLRAIGEPSGHSSKEGASASSSSAPLTRRGGKSAPRGRWQRPPRQGSVRGQSPLRARGRQRRVRGALTEGLDRRPARIGGARDVQRSRGGTRTFARPLEHDVREESLKLVSVVKRTRPGLRVEVSYLGVRDAAARAALITSGTGRFVSGARARESVASIGEEHLSRCFGAARRREGGVARCGGPGPSDGGGLLRIGRQGAGWLAAHLKPARRAPLVSASS